MIGSLLAGIEESPGTPMIREGRRYKIVRGMASLTANSARKAIEKDGVVGRRRMGRGRRREVGNDCYVLRFIRRYHSPTGRRAAFTIKLCRGAQNSLAVGRG